MLGCNAEGSAPVPPPWLRQGWQHRWGPAAENPRTAAPQPGCTEQAPWLGTSCL